MGTEQTVPELVAAAKADLKASDDRVSEILKLVEDQKASQAELDDLRAATVALEAAAVDVFSLFEARMQHHFKRGPFSRKLTAVLLDDGQNDLAHRVHQYYLVINVLKHGKGASYRELRDTPSALFDVKTGDDVSADQTDAPSGLIDITVAGFFDGLTATILEAYQFLENR